MRLAVIESCTRDEGVSIPRQPPPEEVAMRPLLIRYFCARRPAPRGELWQQLANLLPKRVRARFDHRAIEHFAP